MIASTLFYSFAWQNGTSGLIGTWIFAGKENGCERLTRIRHLKKSRPGFKFLKNGKLINRSTIGWCGTPPIKYKNYPGTWKQTTDSTLMVTFEYWGGEATRDLLIVELTERQLIVKVTDWINVE